MFHSSHKTASIEILPRRRLSPQLSKFWWWGVAQILDCSLAFGLMWWVHELVAHTVQGWDVRASILYFWKVLNIINNMTCRAIKSTDFTGVYRVPSNYWKHLIQQRLAGPQYSSLFGQSLDHWQRNGGGNKVFWIFKVFIWRFQNKEFLHFSLPNTKIIQKNLFNTFTQRTKLFIYIYKIMKDE